MKKVIKAYEDFDEFDDDYYDEDSEWELVDSKSVPDSDGFYTDYSMYRSTEDGTYIFMFGDRDIYTPNRDDADWECDTEQEAYEWFENYHGFDDDEDIYSSETIESGWFVEGRKRGINARTLMQQFNEDTGLDAVDDGEEFDAWCKEFFANMES
jgi:hypothetical protein